MFDELIEKMKQEKIAWPTEQYDKGWNGAIDYIISEHLEPDQLPQTQTTAQVLEQTRALAKMFADLEQMQASSTQED